MQHLSAILMESSLIWSVVEIRLSVQSQELGLGKFDVLFTFYLCSQVLNVYPVHWLAWCDHYCMWLYITPSVFHLEIYSTEGEAHTKVVLPLFSKPSLHSPPPNKHCIQKEVEEGRCKDISLSHWWQTHWTAHHKLAPSHSCPYAVPVVIAAACFQDTSTNSGCVLECRDTPTSHCITSFHTLMVTIWSLYPSLHNVVITI